VGRAAARHPVMVPHQEILHLPDYQRGRESPKLGAPDHRAGLGIPELRTFRVAIRVHYGKGELPPRPVVRRTDDVPRDSRTALDRGNPAPSSTAYRVAECRPCGRHLEQWEALPGATSPACWWIVSKLSADATRRATMNAAGARSEETPTPGGQARPRPSVWLGMPLTALPSPLGSAHTLSGRARKSDNARTK
jgi:hypothetical protein